jgi:N-acyl-D-amino-acid deacylase
MAKMQEMVTRRWPQGAIGVSTGLYYEPARAAPCEEVIEICRPLSKRNGIYCTHMRDEGEHILDSLEESFRVGRELGIPVVISHHKVAGKANHGRSAETLPFIEKAMRSQKIGLDCYPYHASSTILSASRVANASKVLVTWSKPHPEVAGMDLERHQAKFKSVVEELLPRERSTSPWTRRTCSASWPSQHHDRLRRPAARRGAAPAAVGQLPEGARALLARPEPVPAGNRGSQDDRPHRQDLRAWRAAAC